MRYFLGQSEHFLHGLHLYKSAQFDLVLLVVCEYEDECKLLVDNNGPNSSKIITAPLHLLRQLNNI